MKPPDRASSAEAEGEPGVVMVAESLQRALEETVGRGGGNLARVRFPPPPLLDGYPEIAIEKDDGCWSRFAFALD